MKRTLLRYLACPRCGCEFSLEASEQENDHVVSGTLLCGSCGESYPVIGGIPRILPRSKSRVEKRTADIFGFEWKKFSAHYPVFREQFLDWIYPVGSDFFRDKVVLDAGCGMGRHLTLSAEFGAGQVIGVDASEAVEAAYDHTKDMGNVHVIQADIYHLPLKPVFDYAYSIGVLHHLPQPGEGFMKLAGLLKPGGAVSAWVYGRENNGFAVNIVSPLRRHVISKLPRVVSYMLSFAITFLLYPVTLAYRGLSGLAPRAVSRLPFGTYFLYLSRFNFRFNWANVFDHITAPIAYYLSREEFGTWFGEAGLIDVTITHRNKNSWRGHGKKPCSGSL